MNNSSAQESTDAVVKSERVNRIAENAKEVMQFLLDNHTRDLPVSRARLNLHFRTTSNDTKNQALSLTLRRLTYFRYIHKHMEGNDVYFWSVSQPCVWTPDKITPLRDGEDLYDPFLGRSVAKKEGSVTWVVNPHKEPTDQDHSALAPDSVSSVTATVDAATTEPANDPEPETAVQPEVKKHADFFPTAQLVRDFVPSTKLSPTFPPSKSIEQYILELSTTEGRIGRNDLIVRVSDLSRKVYNTVSNVVYRMVREGKIETYRDEKDGRKTWVRLPTHKEEATLLSESTSSVAEDHTSEDAVPEPDQHADQNTDQQQTTENNSERRQSYVVDLPDGRFIVTTPERDLIISDEEFQLIRAHDNPD